MIMYHQTKFGSKQIKTLEDTVETFGSKRIKTSEDTVETVIFFIILAFNVTFTLKIAKSFFFPQDTPAHDNIPPFHVWIKKRLNGSGDIIPTNIHGHFKPSI